ncbi:PepSY domain-containing protein [Wenxinia saemankumensis]|uniref:Peptidase propeptide and YPEB domain-containing protein n=1 Tax=Wenxinia saemankumensis TaxID=1447782 RepID=A0A1M6E9J9_9RHOB|nr:PepSY domain-containing protein [Wenxinia saemankumensis]SHI82142.1 Peptidase propeptide and YPEB domain-containing protein [Wenxinia saemankumensis]
MTTRILLSALALAALPLAAAAMPQVGDMVGTNPEDATAALAGFGCTVDEFEAEDGMIEAKCTDETGKMWEVYIDPADGTVAQIKDED